MRFSWPKKKKKKEKKKRKKTIHTRKCCTISKTIKRVETEKERETNTHVHKHTDRHIYRQTVYIDGPRTSWVPVAIAIHYDSDISTHKKRK